MQIQLNGEKKKLPEQELIITDFLKSLSIDNPHSVMIEINGEFVDKNKYNSEEIKDGDKIEILYFMGGG